MPLFRYVNISEFRKLVWGKLDRDHPHLKPEIKASIYGFLWLYVEHARVAGKDQGWMYCSVDFLSERLNRTPNQIRWLLHKILKKSEIITIKTTNQGTAIRFRNYWEIFLSTKPKTTNENKNKPQTNPNERGTGMGEDVPTSSPIPPEPALAASPSGSGDAPANGGISIEDQEPVPKEIGKKHIKGIQDMLAEKKREKRQQLASAVPAAFEPQSDEPQESRSS